VSLAEYAESAERESKKGLRVSLACATGASACGGEYADSAEGEKRRAEREELP